MDALIIFKFLTYLLLFITIIGYLMFSLYAVRLFKKFNEIFVYSNNVYFNCQQIKNGKSIIEKDTNRNIQYNEINDANLNEITKKLKSKNYIIGLYLITFALIIITNFGKIAIFLKSSDSMLPMKVISFIIFIFIPLIVFIYMNEVTFKVLNGPINADLSNYGANLIALSKVFELSEKTQKIPKPSKILDINYTSSNKTVQLFKYYMIKKILFVDDLEAYQDAVVIYENNFNDYRNGYCHLLDYINFDASSLDHKLFKALLCGGLSANITIPTNFNINQISSLIDDNQILTDIEAKTNGSSLTEIELAIKDLMTMPQKDFQNFINIIKNLYLFDNSDYTDYQSSIEAQLINYPNALRYFSFLEQSDPIWEVWQTVTANDKKLEILFSNNSCNVNTLGLEQSDLKNINSALISLSTNNINTINTELKNIINTFMYLMIFSGSVVFYALFHLFYKLNSSMAINCGIALYIFYCIEEAVRINILLE